jgi:CheY-like chemotaxis protein
VKRGRSPSVLDPMMPEVDGFAVLEALREQQGLEVPVVACSAADDPQNRRRAMELGARELIPKAMPWAEVYDHLSRHL